MIPYIPASVHPPLQQQYPKYSNIIKTFANQNVCYTCRFDVEDWHTAKIRDIRMVSPVPFTWNTRARIIHSAGKLCTKPCIPAASDGVGR